MSQLDGSISGILVLGGSILRTPPQKKAQIKSDGLNFFAKYKKELQMTIAVLGTEYEIKKESYEKDELFEIAKNPAYFATMMLATGRADAMVAGATVATASTLRPIFQIIPLQKGFSAASSMMVVSTGNEELGIHGDLFLSDCGVIPEPTDKQLCDIAITTAVLVNHLTLETPRVAMLSYVSKLPTAKLPSITKVKSAS